MNRAEVLRLTGLTNVAFDNLANRKSLPFEPRQADGSARHTYSAFDVLKLSIALSLGAQGLDRQSAGGLVRAHSAELHEAMRDRSGRSVDVYFAFGDFVAYGATSEEAGAVRREAFVATRSALGPAMDRRAKATKTPLIGFGAVNVSECLRRLQTLIARDPNSPDLIAQFDQIWSADGDASAS